MTTDPRPAVHIGPAGFSAAELAADDLVERAIAERLPRLRTVASSWGATVGGITALFGAGVVIDADDRVRALTPAAGILYGVLAALALSAAAASLYLAALAAESRPRRVGSDLDSRTNALDEVFRKGVRALMASRLCAALAVLLLIASMAVRWYGPLKGT